MNRAEFLFTSYNDALEEGSKSIIPAAGGRNMPSMEEFGAAIENAERQWLDTSYDALDGRTPRAFICEISGLEPAVELFKTGARISDEGLPDLFLDKLKSFDGAAVAEMMRFASDLSLIGSEEDFYIALMAIRALGQWRVAEAVEPLLCLMFSLSEENELFLDEISSALGEIGKPAVGAIVGKLDTVTSYGIAHEFLINALGAMDPDAKTEEAYQCLKNVFMKAENKIFAAAVLGDYGDSRAIPMLKGYLLKNIQTVDRDTFYEIKLAIEKLGGNTEDIKVF